MSSPPPKRIDVDPDRLREIVRQSRLRPLAVEEHELLEALLETTLWLTNELRSERLSARRLYRMLFGPTSEKTNVVLANDNEAADSKDAGDSEQKGDGDPTVDGADGRTNDSGDKKKPKGHGRNPADAYRGAERICVSHGSLKPGHSCPACLKGKVYRMQRPKVVVRITGRAPLAASVYESERLRCNLCGAIITAHLPADAKGPKYDETAAAMIAILRYGYGLAHNRLDKLQRSLGVPLPASTQWKVVKEAAPSVAPAYDCLVAQSAQGDVIHNDDTKMPVLALTGKRRAREAPQDDPADRTGMFTTGIVSLVEGRRIALYFTGRRHAGENLAKVLKHRDPARDPPTLMCDGLARNIPKEQSTILANCLAHARRHFVNVADNFPSECRFVFNKLARVFRNEAHCHKDHLSGQERLAYHIEHSAMVMAELKAWFEAQFEQRTVEPNSGLGQAFNYMLKRWEALTLFLRKPGAPLENNIVERILKRAICHRNNSLFYKTLEGARVGDMYMSLIHTAELCGADPFDYLVALQRYADAVRLEPAAWLPHNYADARARLLAQAA